MVTDTLSNRLQTALKKQLFQSSIFVDEKEASLLRTTINEDEHAHDDSELIKKENPGLVTLFKKHSNGLDLNQLIADKKAENKR